MKNVNRNITEKLAEEQNIKIEKETVKKQKRRSKEKANRLRSEKNSKGGK